MHRCRFVITLALVGCSGASSVPGAAQVPEVFIPEAGPLLARTDVIRASPKELPELRECFGCLYLDLRDPEAPIRYVIHPGTTVEQVVLLPPADWRYGVSIELVRRFGSNHLRLKGIRSLCSLNQLFSLDEQR